MSLPTEAPHIVVGQIFDGVINGAEGLGQAIIDPLNKLPLGTNGPQEGLDDIIDGVLNGIKSVGNGISDALDLPLNLVNV